MKKKVAYQVGQGGQIVVGPNGITINNCYIEMTIKGNLVFFVQIISPLLTKQS